MKAPRKQRPGSGNVHNHLIPVTSAALAVTLCIGCLTPGTYAWFSDNITSSVSSIRSARFALSIECEPPAGQESKSLVVSGPDDEGVWTFGSSANPTQQGTYTFTLTTANDSASKGYCKVEAQCYVNGTEGPNKDETCVFARGDTVVLKVTVPAGCSLTFTPCWKSTKTEAANEETRKNQSMSFFGATPATLSPRKGEIEGMPDNAVLGDTKTPFTQMPDAIQLGTLRQTALLEVPIGYQLFGWAIESEMGGSAAVPDISLEDALRGVYDGTEEESFTLTLRAVYTRIPEPEKTEEPTEPEVTEAPTEPETDGQPEENENTAGGDTNGDNTNTDNTNNDSTNTDSTNSDNAGTDGVSNDDIGSDDTSDDDTGNDDTGDDDTGDDDTDGGGTDGDTAITAADASLSTENVTTLSAAPFMARASMMAFSLDDDGTEDTSEVTESSQTTPETQQTQPSTEPQETEASTEPETTEAPTEPEVTEAPTEPEVTEPEETTPSQNTVVSKIAPAASIPLSDEQLRQRVQILLTAAVEPEAAEDGPSGTCGVPLYFQNDYPYTRYGSGTIATSGCGITSVAMVATYMTGHEYLPDELAGYFGGRAENNIERLKIASEALQLPYEQAENWDVAYQALEDGKIVILLVDYLSSFTDSQHFIVLTGLTEDGKVLVNDPNRDNYSKWDLKDGFENGFTAGTLIQGWCGAWIYDKSAMPEIPVIYYEDPPVRPEMRYPTVVLTQQEIDLLARVVWVEAQGESAEGQQAVAEVALNRLVSDGFPDNLYDVIYGEGQFRSVPYLDDATPWQAQYDAIENALYGPYVLPMDVYYFARTATNDNVWGQIGGHIFCFDF